MRAKELSDEDAQALIHKIQIGTERVINARGEVSLKGATRKRQRDLLQKKAPFVAEVVKRIHGG